jgi:uncharacterized cupin superfamily protein
MHMRLYNISNINHQELISSRTGEKYSLSAVLTQLIDFKHLFIHHEILSPGRRSSSPHCHSHQEEMIFVLTGHPTAHLGEQIFQLKPGDFLGFKPSTSEYHFIKNCTDSEASVLVIACAFLEDTIRFKE